MILKEAKSELYKRAEELEMNIFDLCSIFKVAINDIEENNQLEMLNHYQVDHSETFKAAQEQKKNGTYKW